MIFSAKLPFFICAIYPAKARPGPFLVQNVKLRKGTYALCTCALMLFTSEIRGRRPVEGKFL